VKQYNLIIHAERGAVDPPLPIVIVEVLGNLIPFVGFDVTDHDAPLLMPRVRESR
jgi:hypothetical protein